MTGGQTPNLVHPNFQISHCCGLHVHILDLKSDSKFASPIAPSCIHHLHSCLFLDLPTGERGTHKKEAYKEWFVVWDLGFIFYWGTSRDSLGILSSLVRFKLIT